MTPDINARLKSLVGDVLIRLRHEPDIGAAFALAEWTATLLWKNHSDLYRLDALETVLLDKLTPLPGDAAAPAASTPLEIHLATEVYRSGGHTPLMAHLIQHADQPVNALLTRMTDLDMAAQALGVTRDQVHGTGQHAHPVDRVHALARHLLRGSRVIASLHPNDVVGAVALRMAKRLRPDLPIGFMNHADHVFSVGIGAADHVFEISAYGWTLREARGITDRATFVGIPIRPRPAAARTQAVTQPPRLLTGGSPYKFRPLPGLSLPPVLATLLTRHPTAHLTVLGPKSKDWWWWPLRARFRHRLRIRQALPKEQYQQLVQDGAIYIDSHPIPGGTAFPEALMAGSQVAGIRGVVWGYSCADELLSSDPPSFVAHCERLLDHHPETLDHQQAIRLRCMRWHAPEAVRQRLNASWSGGIAAPPSPILNESPSARPLELLWQRANRLALPGRRECPLDPDTKKWLARRHVAHFGLHAMSTLKTLFYAHVRS